MESMKQTIETYINKRLLLLDGAMGTMIQQYGLTEDDFRGSLFANIDWQMRGNNDLLSITKPEVITDIHEKYLCAGADIIETNTFNAQAISMADYHCEKIVKDINVASCRLARKVADKYTSLTPDKPRWVAGSIGPTNKTLSLSPDVENPAYRAITFNQMADAYKEQIEVMVDEGVDALLIETIFDTLNAKAAIWAAETILKEKNKNIPIMLSVTIADKAGRTLSGQTIDAFISSIGHANILSVGLNCSFGPDMMLPFLREMSRVAQGRYYITAHPNAGLPNKMGGYDVTPEAMAEMMQRFVDEGLVNIIGGCCGTTDLHIRAISELVKKSTIRPCKCDVKAITSFSGLESLKMTDEVGFVNVGERCNVAGSRKFLRLIQEKNYDEALRIARKQVEDGAMVLDINMDDAMLDAKTEMTTFLNLLASDPDVAKVPVMIDSSKFEVIEAALKCIQGKCIVNSISLKEGEEVFLEKAEKIRSLGAAVIVMAFDENGQATSYEHKIKVCERAYNLLTEKLDFPPTDIIFDTNVLTIGTGMAEHNAYAIDFIKAAKWIRQNLKGAHVSGGVSNLSFAFRGNNYLREAMHAVFLYHAIQNGLDMAIVNPSTKVMYDDIDEELRKDLENLIFNIDAEKIVEKLTKETIDIANTQTAEKVKEKITLTNALIEGGCDNFEELINEAISQYDNALEIIEGPLMEGMNKVGKRFAEGKMFLPQVIKSARFMKQVVGYLTEHTSLNNQEVSLNQKKVLIATVKGDVHDIGKNIVSVVMACNGYNIIDLGVMCPAEKIVEEAINQKVDMIMLSGLITPSLDEMINTVIALKKAGVSVPVMIGGATTSKEHTLMKIAPNYDGKVIWVKDASQNVIEAAKLF